MNLAIKVLLVICGTLSLAEFQASAFEGPKNTLAYIGEQVVLSCVSSTRNCSGIGWQMIRSNNDHPKYIFRDDLVWLNRDRYSVDNSSGGCHLVISPVIHNDSGRYYCTTVRTDKSTEVRSGQLVVLDSRPTCQVNGSTVTNDTTVVEGDLVTLSCELTHSSLHGMARVSWKDAVNSSSIETRNATVRHIYSIVAGGSNIQPLVCEVSFEESSARLPDDAASNSLAVNCETPIVEVFFSVRNILLSPPSLSFPPGSVVTCQAEGKPSPVIRWQSLKTRNSSAWRDIPGVEGNLLTVGNDRSERYRCIASNSFRNISHREISCQISVGERVPTTAESIGVGFVVGFFAALVLTAVVCLLKNRFKEKKTGNSNEYMNKEVDIQCKDSS